MFDLISWVMTLLYGAALGAGSVLGVIAVIIFLDWSKKALSVLRMIGRALWLTTRHG